ncbi:MAG TPA: hypothetical protein VKH81_17040 [Candidatus Angelobacter sp.]|nr:hypothetical protein [Candidatus Angelobacter sp.]
MESVYQDEEVQQEAVLTPQDQIRLQWRQQPGFISLIRQKNVIERNAELLPYAGTAALDGWIPPRMFALQGLVLLSLIASLLNWPMTLHAGKLEDQITSLQASVQTETTRQQEIIAATQAEIARISRSSKASFKLHLSATPMTREEALLALNSALEESQRSEEQYKEKMATEEQRLRARQSALAIANSGTPLIFSLALVLAANLIGRGGQNLSRNRQAKWLTDYYLYFATAEGLWPNLVLIVFLHIALSRNAYGVSGLFESVGPLFWVVFSAGFYFLLLRYFVVVARDINQAMQIRRPANEYSLDNRMLLRIHNSVLIVFVGLEAAFLVLCYGLYLAQKS